MIVIVLPCKVGRRRGLAWGRIKQIIGVVLIDQRRSDIERVTHVIGIGNATIRLVHGIVDDLEKVRVAGWQRVERVRYISNDRNSWDQ